VRISNAGKLHHVSSPHHRIVFITAGSCNVSYLQRSGAAKCRLTRGSLCFLPRDSEFACIAWKGSNVKAIVIDMFAFGSNPNPIDQLACADSTSDIRMGFEDAAVATLIELMRFEIDSDCPSGATYGKALSIALASRVTSVVRAR